MRLLPPVLLVVVVLGAVPAADGATVNVERRCENPTFRLETRGNVMTFEVARGEANDVTAEPAGAGELVVRDAGAPLTAQGPCKQIDAASARCPNAAGVLYVTGNVALGDGDDRLALPAAITLPVTGHGAGPPFGVTASDAAGDVLRGDAGPNVLDGHDGADTIFGGGGDDKLDGNRELDGGDGDDRLDGGFKADVLRRATGMTDSPAGRVPT